MGVFAMFLIAGFVVVLWAPTGNSFQKYIQHNKFEWNNKDEDTTETNDYDYSNDARVSSAETRYNLANYEEDGFGKCHCDLHDTMGPHKDLHRDIAIVHASPTSVSCDSGYGACHQACTDLLQNESIPIYNEYICQSVPDTDSKGLKIYLYSRICEESVSFFTRRAFSRVCCQEHETVSCNELRKKVQVEQEVDRISLSPKEGPNDWMYKLKPEDLPGYKTYRDRMIYEFYRN